MVKNSTLFYFYDNFNLKNELYESDELTAPGEIEDKELSLFLDKLELTPRDDVIEKILNEIF